MTTIDIVEVCLLKARWWYTEIIANQLVKVRMSIGSRYSHIRQKIIKTRIAKRYEKVGILSTILYTFSILNTFYPKLQILEAKLKHFNDKTWFQFPMLLCMMLFKTTAKHKNGLNVYFYYKIFLSK